MTSTPSTEPSSPFFAALAAQRHVDRPEHAVTAGDGAPIEVVDPDAYARTAIDGLCAELASTVEGGRNQALNAAAFRLGQLGHGLALDADDVADRLIAACEANGLLGEDGERRVRLTIDSGWSGGARAPRAVVVLPPVPAATPFVLPTAVATAPSSRLVLGGRFIHDAPAVTPAVWGAGVEILWAQGEPLLISGPPGVGKTTLGAQVVAGRMGLLHDVLGYPVAPGRRVLYLASDRPAQIGRALRRLYGQWSREQLDDRLVVWRGPLDTDLAANPRHLLELAAQADADTVVVDSLKDVAAKLSDDETGQRVNTALQHCVAEGVEVLAYHHQTKRGDGGKGKPNTLADVYGSAWLTAGAGSVVVLWGAAGDPVVELLHLKQPAEVVGPLRILHDHTAGTSTVQRAPDVLAVLRAGGEMSAAEVASAAYGDTGEAMVQRVRRRLERHVSEGHVTRSDALSRGGSGGGSRGATYAAIATHAATDTTPFEAPTDSDR